MLLKHILSSFRRKSLFNLYKSGFRFFRFNILFWKIDTQYAICHLCFNIILINIFRQSKFLFKFVVVEFATDVFLFALFVCFVGSFLHFNRKQSIVYRKIEIFSSCARGCNFNFILFFIFGNVDCRS